MSGVENDPDLVYEIDQDTFDQINEIVHDVKTRYTTWYEFVNEAVRIFTTWWDSPPDAEKILYQELWPHLTSKQHKIMKDTKFGGSLVLHETLRKKAEEYCRENKIPLVSTEIEVDTEFQNKAIRDLKENGYLQYTIRGRRVQDIEEILKTAKSDSGAIYYGTYREFMKHTIRLYIIYWRNPHGIRNQVLEMFPFLTKMQCRRWYELDPSEKGGYLTFKKLAEDHYRSIGQKLIKDDGIEQLIEQQKKTREQYRQSNLDYEKEQEEDPLTDEMREMFERENENDMEKLAKTTKYYAIRSFNKEFLERNKKDIKNFKKKDRFTTKYLESVTSFSVIPSEDNTLIWAFYSRFFPTKLVLTVLADMITKNGGDPVSYLDFRKEAYEKAIVVSELLKNFEHEWVNEKDGKIGLPRNKKISTGLPLPIDENEKDRTKIIKSEASKERFLEYFVGVSIKQWNRKYHDKKKFNGALNSMGLVHITDSEDGLKITLSNIGAEFYNIDNEILNNFQEKISNMTKPLKPVNDKESAFIMDKIITKYRFPQEKKYVDCVYKELDRNRHWVFGKELDEACFGSNKELRQATMGRLAEMDLVDWRIGSKKQDDREANWGKSCFKLNYPLKNI